MLRRLTLAVLLSLLLLPGLALASSSTEAAPSSWLVGLLGTIAVALVGAGIVPSGSQGTELSAITRRAFVPKLTVQFGNATPVSSAFLANAQGASGGISSITVPIQMSAMTTAQATGYDGSFSQPANQTGIQNAEFNLCCVLVPIGYLGFEGILQMNAAVIPRIEATMNDAGNQLAKFISDQLFANATAGTLNPDGFPLMTSATSTYGNIDRSLAANANWRPLVIASPAAISGTTNNNRAGVASYIVRAAQQNGGEMPNMGIMAYSTWMKLQLDFISLEQIQRGKAGDFNYMGPDAAFTALNVLGVPIFLDPGMTEQQLILLNTRYLAAYIHEAAAFAFTGFASTLPNMQLGYIGAALVVLQFVCTKSASLTLVTGLDKSF